MKIKNILLLLLLTSLVACSSSETDDTEVAETATEESLEDQVLDEDADFVVESDEDDEASEEVEEEIQEGPEEEVTMEEERQEAPVNNAPVVASSGEYVVQRGDTLMLIAFKLKGDYGLWREIADANGISDDRGLQVGMKLSYVSNGFTWNPQGLPHLIRSGETLGSISTDKYGTDRKWRDIWDNNRPMIKDPNLIFAGFTLYYIPAEDRDLASENNEM